MKTIKLTNTLTKRVDTLKTDGKEVKMFVCGPTVYDYSHIGHAKTYIQMDTLARMLRALGYELFYLQNITDIDDKIITRAKEENVDWQELRSRYQEAYLEDVKTLNIISVDKYARATDYVDDIIRQVTTLLDKGFAYEIEGDGIYFEIAKFGEYGKLSGRTEVESDDAQTRIDESEGKRGWNDFCLWKFSKPGEPIWDAPFGEGRPGWHIEDTAITEHHFGAQYDLHGGAIDLIFPHHEAEITQMESVSGKSPFVRHWVHTGFLNIKGDKMSKSLGNFYTIREIDDKGYEPMSLRLLMLQSHYRSSIDFSWEQLDAATARLRDMRAVADLRWQLVEGGEHPADIDFKSRLDSFMESMANDLNTPQALANLSTDLAFISSHLVNKKQEAEFTDYLQKIDNVLGLRLLESEDIDANQKELLALRAKARKEGSYAKSDELRTEIEQTGLDVRDTPYGQIWSRL